MFRSLLLLPTFIISSYALVHAVDSSSLVPESTYVKARGEGFTKAIIRGYEEACGVGGEVDPNFVPTYKNARAAGYTNIDTYWFPCNGSGHNCKSYATQLSELAATFKANSMDIGTIWIDLEKDSVCNNVGLPNSVQFAYTNFLHFPHSGIMVPMVISLKLGISLLRSRPVASSLAFTVVQE